MGAPLNPVPNVFRVVIEGTAGGRPWANILHFGWSGSTPTNATCTTIAGGFTTAWADNVLSMQPAPIVLTTAIVTDLSSPTAGEGVAAVNAPGTRGDDTIGGNTCVLVSYPVQGRYKGGHPRTYLFIGGNADNASTTTWNTTFIDTEVTTKWRAFLTGVVGFTTAGTTINSFGFVRYRGKFFPNGGPPHYYLDTPQYITLNPALATPQIQMASQRRRIGRVRR